LSKIKKNKKCFAHKNKKISKMVFITFTFDKMYGRIQTAEQENFSRFSLTAKCLNSLNRKDF